MLLVGFSVESEALRKCPQPDGSILSVPDSVTCDVTPPGKVNRPAAMAEACDLLYGYASRNTPMWQIPEKLRATGVSPSWGQCDELQRQQVRGLR
jgi:hypothetical protein